MKYDSKNFHIRYQATINSSGADNDIRVWVAQPVNSTYQKINRFSIFPKPESFYKDEAGNKILYFNFKNSKHITLQMDIKATLWKEKINLKNDLLLPKTINKFINRHTKSEKFLEQTPEIINLTHDIVKDNELIIDKVRSIFNFITKNFKYCYPVNHRGVKNLNLKNLRGDCGEYSSLFVTMCRILGAPAINRTGFVIFPKQETIEEHGWTSVYLEPLGWLDFDTQYAALEKNTQQGLKKYFGQRSDYRIVFTNDFNIPLKPSIHRNFRINYWGELGLPLTRQAAQILQPLVFASKDKVRFEDSIL